MMSSFRCLLACVPCVALATACVDAEGLFGGGNGEGGGPADGGSPSTGGNAPTGAAPSGGGDEGGAPPGCGDGDLDADEECDGENLAGQDCTSFGSATPAGLVCTENCNLDSSGCVTTCGNGSIENGEICDDGNTQPNDGCSASCKPELGNCSAPEPVALPPGTLIVTGSTGGASMISPSGAQNCTGASGAEKVFQVTPAASGYLTAYLPSQAASMDSVLYAQTGCDGAAVQRLCNDNSGTPGNQGGELISFHVEAGVPVLIVVDGFQPGDSGAFDLSLDLSEGDTCAGPVPLVIEGSGSIVALGNTSGETSDGFASEICALAGYGPDIIYEVLTPEGGSYDFALTASSFNSVIHARTDCGEIATQIACDAPPATNNASIEIDVENGATTLVFADGHSNNSGGYVLTISP
jgi:cysteine-rich repeat protein